jgi:hypothetical protein
MVTAHQPVVDERGRPVGPLARGAGRIDVARASNPPFFADPPSVGFGPMRPGETRRATIRLVGGRSRAAFQAEAVPFAPSFPARGIAVTVQPERFVLGPNEYVDLTLQLTILPGAPPADHEGDLLIRGPDGVSRLPFWSRLPSARTARVLLLDNDGSSDLGLPDVADRYREALEALSIPFEVIDADAAPARTDTGGVLPPLWVLQQFRTVVWLTGERSSPGPPRRARVNSRDHDLLADYLHGGGRLIGFGRRFGEAIDVGARRDPVYGRSRLYQAFFGAQVRRTAPAPEVVAGTPGSPLAGHVFRLLTSGELPVVQVYSLAPEYPDDRSNPTAFPLVEAGGDPFGVYQASEPTPAEPRRRFAFRTALLGFGLEDVAPEERTVLLGLLLAWAGE